MNILGQGYPAFEHLDLQTDREPTGNARPVGVSGAVINGQLHGAGSMQNTVPTQGQVFWGEILDITSQGIKIQLNPQQVLFARLGEQVELNIGQQMAFQVKERQGEQIIIRPAQEQNAGSMLAAERALSANGFTQTERNVQIVQSMMQEGLPLNRETIRSMMQSAVEHPEADIRQLAAMHRLNIPITQENIEQFQAYRNGEHQLSVQTESILQSVESALQTLSENGSIQQLQILNQNLQNIFAWKEAGTGEGDMTLPQAVANPETGATGTEELSQLLKSLQIPEEDAQRLLQNPKGTGTMLAELTNYLAEYSALDAGVEQEAAIGCSEALRTFLQSDCYRGLVIRSMRESWSLRPAEMQEPEEIDELYRSLFTQASKLEEAFQSAGSSNSELSEHAQNMRDNLQFMQELNKQFVYAQVPLNMEEGPVNSELFVYARKKQKQVSEDGTKVLLHLDMPNLGMTDILVSLKGKRLHAGFTMEDGVSIDLMRQHMGELQELLEKKGFVYTNEIQRAEPQKIQKEASGKEDHVITEMLQTDRLQTGQAEEEKRYTFDMRT